MVSPGNGKVYVTGTSTGKGTEYDYSTVAYSTATGAQLWVKRYYSPGILADEAASLAVNPARTRVFVTGSSGDDYATVAYNAATGAQLWVKRYNGPGNSYDMAASLAVNPSGTRVFVTGASEASRYHTDYGTIAYQG